MFGAVLAEVLQSFDQLVGVERRVELFEHRVSPVEVPGPAFDDPIAQRHGRRDVVLVVARDLLEQRWVLRRHIAVVDDHGARALFDTAVPNEAGEVLERLQSVGLGAHLQCVLRHHVEVHEQPRRHQRGEETLGLGTSCQSLQR